MADSISMLFLLPVFVILAMIIGAWLYYSGRNPELDKPAGEGKIYRCEHCNLVYVERRLYPVLECPRCHHPNAAIRR